MRRYFANSKNDYITRVDVREDRHGHYITQRQLDNALGRMDAVGGKLRFAPVEGGGFEPCELEIRDAANA